MPFLLRLQQRTGPIRAKGVEDTALYRDHTLISLNEVGGAPSAFGRTSAAFHAGNACRLRTWPWSILDGDYHGLEVPGREQHVVAFMRRRSTRAAIVLAGRHLARVVAPDSPLAVDPAVWAGAVVNQPAAWSGRRFRNLLTGRTIDASPAGTVRLASAMDGLPASILLSDDVMS